MSEIHKKSAPLPRIAGVSAQFGTDGKFTEVPPPKNINFNRSVTTKNATKSPLNATGKGSFSFKQK
jgi:hypothetical protein